MFLSTMLSPVGAAKNVCCPWRVLNGILCWPDKDIPSFPRDAYPRVGRKAKKRLEQARLAFLVDLWKLRGLVERMTRAAEEDTSEGAGVLSEATQIHFFVPCQTYCVDGSQYFRCCPMSCLVYDFIWEKCLHLICYDDTIWYCWNCSSKYSSWCQGDLLITLENYTLFTQKLVYGPATVR